MCHFFVPHVFLLSVLFTQAMAVVFLDGTVLTWGDPGSGGCSAQVQKDLYDIQVGDPSISIPLELVTSGWACLKVRNFDPCVLVLCPRDSITRNTPGSLANKDNKDIQGSSSVAFKATTCHGSSIAPLHLVSADCIHNFVSFPDK